MPKFRSKVVEIEAIQWNGNLESAEVIREEFGEDIVIEYGDDRLLGLSCKTKEGPLSAAPNDWIIRGLIGEVYPCKPDVFAMKYEPAEGLAQAA